VRSFSRNFPLRSPRFVQLQVIVSGRRTRFIFRNIASADVSHVTKFVIRTSRCKIHSAGSITAGLLAAPTAIGCGHECFGSTSRETNANLAGDAMPVLASARRAASSPQAVPLVVAHCHRAPFSRQEEEFVYSRCGLDSRSTARFLGTTEQAADCALCAALSSLHSRGLRVLALLAVVKGLLGSYSIEPDTGKLSTNLRDG
jgi:hypothetical protein